MTRVSDVFVPGTMPRSTYIARDNSYYENRTESYLDELGAIFTIAGPTKSGKTVLLKKLVQTPLWLDGGRISSIDDFWSEVFDELGLYSESDHSTSDNRTDSETAGGGLRAVGINVKASSTSGASETVVQRLSTSRTKARLASEALKEERQILVIDDFHYIPHEVQRMVIRALKPLVFERVPVIFLTTSHRIHDVIRAESEMGSRSSVLQFPLWSPSDLLEIATRGFEELRIIDEEQVISRKLVAASFGSPHLMQKLCLEICKLNEIKESSDDDVYLQQPADWEKFFGSVTESGLMHWAEKLITGPETRGQARQTWTLLDGDTRDHYGLVLQAIREYLKQQVDSVETVSLSITKPQLKELIDSLTSSNSPQIDRTTRVLLQMNNIARARTADAHEDEASLHTAEMNGELQSGNPVLEYDVTDSIPRLHIADPFFAFHLIYGWEQILNSSNVAPR